MCNDGGQETLPCYDAPMPAETMPFSEWMRRALFDPERGYYTRHIGTVGRRGDFSTSATVSTALGEAIASWVRAESDSQPKVRTVIEIGGGTGALKKSVRRALGWRMRWKFRFLMVESSPVFREAQQEKTLAKAGVQWFEDLKEALRTCEGKRLPLSQRTARCLSCDLGAVE